MSFPEGRKSSRRKGRSFRSSRKFCSGKDIRMRSACLRKGGCPICRKSQSGLESMKKILPKGKRESMISRKHPDNMKRRLLRWSS